MAASWAHARGAFPAAGRVLGGPAEESPLWARRSLGSLASPRPSGGQAPSPFPDSGRFRLFSPRPAQCWAGTQRCSDACPPSPAAPGAGQVLLLGPGFSAEPEGPLLSV